MPAVGSDATSGPLEAPVGGSTKMSSVPVVGRQDSGSALADTTSGAEARRSDATRDGKALDSNGLTSAQRRAALTLACAARDRAELRHFLMMCGLFPPV